MAHVLVVDDEAGVRRPVRFSLALLRAVAATPTVLAAAERLGVNRSNVYARLHRMARRLDATMVTELVVRARQGVGYDAA